MKGNEKLCPAVIKVIHYWYDKDILNEAVIMKWYENISSENESVKKQVLFSYFFFFVLLVILKKFYLFTERKVFSFSFFCFNG